MLNGQRKDNMNTEITVIKKDALAFVNEGKRLIQVAKSQELVKREDMQSATIILKECQDAEQGLEAKRIEITKPVNDFVKEVNTLFKETVVNILEAKNIIKTKILTFEQEQERIRKEEEQKRFAEEQARLKKLEDERLERERIEQAKREAEEKKLKAEQERLRKLDEARIEKELKAQKLNEAEQQKIRDEAEKQRLARIVLENEKLEIERQKREAEEEKKRIEEEKKLMEAKRLADLEESDRLAQLKVKGIWKKWTWEIVDEEKIPRAFCSPDSKKINEAIKKGIREIDGLRIFESNLVR
jgi:hypothetical protein